jgi:hypothetical protein
MLRSIRPTRAFQRRYRTADRDGRAVAKPDEFASCPGNGNGRPVEAASSSSGCRAKNHLFPRGQLFRIGISVPVYEARRP